MLLGTRNIRVCPPGTKVPLHLIHESHIRGTSQVKVPVQTREIVKCGWRHWVLHGKHRSWRYTSSRRWAFFACPTPDIYRPEGGSLITIHKYYEVQHLFNARPAVVRGSPIEHAMREI